MSLKVNQPDQVMSQGVFDLTDLVANVEALRLDEDYFEFLKNLYAWTSKKGKEPVEESILQVWRYDDQSWMPTLASLGFHEGYTSGMLVHAIFHRLTRDDLLDKCVREFPGLGDLNPFLPSEPPLALLVKHQDDLGVFRTYGYRGFADHSTDASPVALYECESGCHTLEWGWDNSPLPQHTWAVKNLGLDGVLGREDIDIDKLDLQAVYNAAFHYWRVDATVAAFVSRFHPRLWPVIEYFFVGTGDLATAPLVTYNQYQTFVRWAMPLLTSGDQSESLLALVEYMKDHSLRVGMGTSHSVGLYHTSPGCYMTRISSTTPGCLTVDRLSDSREIECFQIDVKFVPNTSNAQAVVPVFRATSSSWLSFGDTIVHLSATCGPFEPANGQASPNVNHPAQVVELYPKEELKMVLDAGGCTSDTLLAGVEKKLGNV